ncbi:placenta-expressed transcript 1 protein [Thomomys bottae]
MAVLRASLPELGLFLYLVLPFSSADFFTYQSNNCVGFDRIVNTTNPGITTIKTVPKDEAFYTVTIPVSDQITEVHTRSVKDNQAIGIWENPTKKCFDNTGYTAVYEMKTLNDTVVRGVWTVPFMVKTLPVELHVFMVDHNNTANFFAIPLNETIITTLTSPASPSSKNDPTSASMLRGKARTTRPSRPTRPTRPTTPKPRTKITPRSLAVRAYSNPIMDAIHILLVSLTAKLLF